MKLTPRQQTFLTKLLDLYRERQEPVHYSLVAERMGVNRFSAYDMLKLLERKGLAASDYVLSAENSGPGRSMIVFYPTDKAIRFLIHRTGEMWVSDEWQQIQERILHRLREARETNCKEMLNEVLTRIPECKIPLVYCAEMIAALLLNLNSVREKACELNLFKAPSVLDARGEVGLGTLAGLSLGTAFAHRADLSLMQKLFSCTEKYQAYLHNLSEESKTILSDFFQEALAIFAGSA